MDAVYADNCAVARYAAIEAILIMCAGAPLASMRAIAESLEDGLAPEPEEAARYQPVVVLLDRQNRPKRK